MEVSSHPTELVGGRRDANKVSRLIKDRGIDALVNECLIGPVMSMGAMFVAFACALLAYLYVLFTSPSYNSENAFTPTIVAFAFLIGLQIANIFTTPLNSGIGTFAIYKPNPSSYMLLRRDTFNTN